MIFTFLRLFESFALLCLTEGMKQRHFDHLITSITTQKKKKRQDAVAHCLTSDHFLSVASPLDFGVQGSILKTRTAWWPLLMLLSFTSSMSGSEFIAQRKLAFHVFGSEFWPSWYFPAEYILFSQKEKRAALRAVFAYVHTLTHLCGRPTS